MKNEEGLECFSLDKSFDGKGAFYLQGEIVNWDGQVEATGVKFHGSSKCR